MELTRLNIAELRVGNLIWNKYYNRIEPLVLGGYETILRKYPQANQIEAVLLTPGMCENLGGIYVTENEFRTTYRFKGVYMDLLVYFDQATPYVIFDKIKVGVPTVHYFQNLFFFLTGRELTYQQAKYSGKET